MRADLHACYIWSKFSLLPSRLRNTREGRPQKDSDTMICLERGHPQYCGPTNLDFCRLLKALSGFVVD